MKNVCFLLSSLQAGGLENYLVRLVEYIPKDDLNILIICRGGQTGVLAERAKFGGASVISIPSGHLNIFAWGKLFTLFRKHKIESMCDFTGNFSAVPLVIGRLVGIKDRMAYYPRSSDAFKKSLFKNLANKFFNYLVYWTATSIIANSSAGLNHFFKNSFFDDRFQVIPNGINAKTFLVEETAEEVRSEIGIPTDAFVVGHVGRFNVAKNHRTIISIAESLLSQYPNLYFILCGKGTWQALNMTKSPEVRKRVIALGYRSDVPRILKGMDLFLFPSITEGQPNALLEAMISGLPFLSSNIPAILEAVPDNHHDQTYDPNDIDGFAQRIIDLMSNPEKMKAMRCPEEAKFRFDAKKNFDLLRKAMNS